jgi:putative SOS response-associated peptidase YedK
MCGRYTLTNPKPEAVQNTFELAKLPEEMPARYNIAPSQPIAVVAENGEGERLLEIMKWGLIPSWSKDPKISNKLINARAEGINEKPSFRSAFKSRRCLIVADGFYEWRKNDDGTKTPMHIRMEDGEPFGFAGLYEHWKEPESGEWLTTCTIITTTPNDLMAPIHNRMPVIMPHESYSLWLDRDIQEAGELLPLLKPFDPDKMTAYAVSTRVNNVANESSELITPQNSL